ncbi:MAG: hypothetical protein PVH86_06050, partial [Thiogranum sp.]
MLTGKTLADRAHGACGPALVGLALLVNGCASDPQAGRYAQAHDSAPQRHINLADVKDAVPRAEPPSRYGNPRTYVVRGSR